MDPRAWRRKQKISLREMAVRLDCAWSSVRRYETGLVEIPNSVALAYERESDGQVTSEDLARTRRRFVSKAGKAA